MCSYKRKLSVSDRSSEFAHAKMKIHCKVFLLLAVQIIFVVSKHVSKNHPKSHKKCHEVTAQTTTTSTSTSTYTTEDLNCSAPCPKLADPFCFGVRDDNCRCQDVCCSQKFCPGSEIDKANCRSCFDCPCLETTSTLIPTTMDETTSALEETT